MWLLNEGPNFNYITLHKLPQRNILGRDGSQTESRELWKDGIKLVVNIKLANSYMLTLNKDKLDTNHNRLSWLQVQSHVYHACFPNTMLNAV